MDRNAKIELLAPAGSLRNLRAAVASGADAVYLGLSKFNAREFAKNFSEKDFLEAVNICKSYGVKMYLTANTLVKNSEIKDFLEQIKFVYESGIDAVIIQDPGFISIIKESFPNIHIHLSTQMGIMNSEHANLFSSIQRINLARELDKENIMRFRKNFNKEIEMFVHGALCACISGSCLFSSLLGGRSGNRGKCAQPCRKLYNNAFILSTKELCLIDRLPEIIRLGVDSIKIEGRMRAPYYTATVTSTYRKAIDSFYRGNFQITPQMKKNLESAFSREFTEGKFADQFIFNLKKAEGSVLKRELEFNIKLKQIKLEKRIAKNIDLEMKIKESQGKKLIVRVYNEKQAIIAEKYADIICLDIFDKNFIEIHNKIKKPLYGVTPRIMFDSDIEKIKHLIKKLAPDGLFAGNAGIINMKFDIPIILDYNANVFNDLQLEYYQTHNVLPIISPELSIKELEQFKNKDFIVFPHGKIRLMTLVHNLAENKIQDEKGFNFFIRKIFNGTEIINEKELGLFNKLRPLVRAGINQVYLDTENHSNFEKVLDLYSQILNRKTPDCSEIQRDYVLGWSKQGIL